MINVGEIIEFETDLHFFTAANTDLLKYYTPLSNKRRIKNVQACMEMNDRIEKVRTFFKGKIRNYLILSME